MPIVHRIAAFLLALACIPAGAVPSPVAQYALHLLPADFTPAAINNLGQVAGTWEGAAAIWSNAGIASLAGAAPGSQGFGINDRGDVVGVVGPSYFGSPFAYISGKSVTIGGFPPDYVVSNATGINNAGVVIGNAIPPVGEAVRGYVWQNGSVQMIGTFGGDASTAAAINDAAHAFLYRDGHLLDLNGLVGETGGWEIVDAYDINDAGQILGKACRGGSCVGVRLDLVSAVAEPSAGVLLLAGVPLVALRRARRPQA